MCGPACPEDVRCGVDADWFERQCHINGVKFPADRGCGVCIVCVEDITVDSSIEVPYCHQRLRVTCLARSFSSRGVNQSLAEFARSFFFLASSLFHGCLVDFDVHPSNRGTNSVRITVLCSAIVIDVIVHCHSAGPFESKCRKQLSLSSCGWVLIRSGQFKITLVAELGIQPLIRSFWTETSAITFSTFSNCCYCFSSSTYGGDWSLSVDGACIIAFSAQCTGL